MPDKEALMQGFQMGPWFVMPERGQLRRDAKKEHIEPLVMDVLVALAVRQGEVLSNDQLIEAAWGGRAVTDDVIVRCIAVLRRNLGDKARAPEYIENIPRRGYRLMMPVTLENQTTSEDPAMLVPEPKAKPAYYWPLIAGFVAVALIYFFAIVQPPVPPVDSGIQSLAVFPLACAAEDEIVCYSFVDELVSQLLQAQDENNIKVVRSREGFPEDPGAETVADELDVDSIFIGSLSRSGDGMRISVEILDRREGFVVWSKVYDGPSDDVINIRSKLVADAVVKLIGDKAELLQADSRPNSIAALDAFSAGQYELSSRSAVSIARAIDLFEKTIALDENFAPAYVRLAYAYMLLPEYDMSASSTLMYEKALSSADAAVQKDSAMMGPAQTVYGFIYHKRGQWTRATEAHLQAISAKTVYPISHQLYSRLLSSVGRLDASLAEARKAHEIEPQQAVQISRLAITYFWLDDLENADIYFRRSDSHKEYEAPVHDLAYSLFNIRSGDFDKAANEAIVGLEKYGLDSSWVKPVFEGIHNPEMRDQAHAIVEQMAESGNLVARVEISLWALLGDADRAIEVAKRLEDFGEVFEAELMFIPQFAIVREHPDFPALLDAVGLTAYWRDNDCEWQSDHVVCEADVDLTVVSSE
jgi:DNA-binding winged helix-turn-helix (wHTH) protein/TolB-like protein/Tfp pilus assembly protein PilF